MTHKHTLYVSGTHCASCKVLIEDMLTEHTEVHNASVDLVKEQVHIELKVPCEAHEAVSRLSPLIESHGYRLSIEPLQKKMDAKSLIYALPIGFAVLALFFWLQKSGLVNLGFEGGLTTRKYVSMAKTSRATAFREISDLLEKGFLLQKSAKGGRSVSYDLNWGPSL